jgi:hypothetical protein
MIGRAISHYEIVEKEQWSGRSPLENGAEEVSVATGNWLTPVCFTWFC